MSSHTTPRSSTEKGATAYTTVGNRLMPVHRPVPRRLVGVWAHPDDEAYLSAGLMARVVDAGGSVTVVTATRGEKGTDDPERYDRPEFGQLREDELRASLRQVGVTSVRFLGLRDGECDLADDGSVIDAIGAVLAEVRPDAVATFGPDGMTNHPDHRAVSRWTTEAWRRHGDGELLYATVTHGFEAAFRSVHQRVGAFADCPGGRPFTVGRSQIALECTLDADELRRKRRALGAHISQTAQLASLIGEETYRIWYRNEHFRHPTGAELDSCSLSARFDGAATPEPVEV